jgi:hypothetical protein
MEPHRRYDVAGTAAALMLAGVLSLSAQAQDSQAPNKEYTIKVAPAGGPTPRLADGHPDFTGLWLPNSAGQGVSGRYGVDPAARRQFDPKVTPEERPPYQPWAAARIKAMTPVELELSKSSVNCMPRGVPAIWLQNPYGTMLVHKPGMFAQMFEVLNNWRLIPTDGRPHTKYPEPLFNGEGVGRWEGDTLVVDGISFDERTFIQPNGWFHSDQLHVIERYTRPSMNYLIVQITVEDPKVLTKPWTSAPRRWTLVADNSVNEMYCTNNHELDELGKLKQRETDGK